MRRLLLAASLVALPSVGLAQRDRMAWPDYVLGGASSALIAVDWLQTLDIARQPWRFTETNPLLGKHPSVGRVNTMIGLGLAANLAVSRLHNRHFRRIVWAVILGAELKAVSGNIVSGVRMRFDF